MAASGRRGQRGRRAPLGHFAVGVRAGVEVKRRRRRVAALARGEQRRGAVARAGRVDFDDHSRVSGSRVSGRRVFGRRAFGEGGEQERDDGRVAELRRHEQWAERREEEMEGKVRRAGWSARGCKGEASQPIPLAPRGKLFRGTRNPTGEQHRHSPAGLARARSNLLPSVRLALRGSAPCASSRRTARAWPLRAAFQSGERPIFGSHASTKLPRSSSKLASGAWLLAAASQSGSQSRASGPTTAPAAPSRRHATAAQSPAAQAAERAAVERAGGSARRASGSPHAKASTFCQQRPWTG